MSQSKINVLIVEDDSQLIRILQAVLKDEAELRIAGTGRLAIQMIEEEAPAIMLLDMRLPDMLGMEVLKEVSRRALPVTVIVMTAHGSVDLAVDAMREGAYDFLTKPLDFERVRVIVRNAVERHRIIAELNNYRSQYERARFRGLMGSSPAMQRLYRNLKSLGSGSSPVMIVGEKGVEFDACARAIHEESARKERSFAEEDCQNLDPENLKKLILEHRNGTVHLGRLETLSSESQGELLSYLREGTVNGDACDTRVLASSETLSDSNNVGEFSGELLSAMEVARLSIAPLRERGEDVLDLGETFLERASKENDRSFAEFADEVEVALVNYDWPGNTEELELAIRSSVLGNEGRILTLEMLPDAVKEAFKGASRNAASPVRGLAATASTKPLWQVEREAIEKALEICEGNVLESARLLEVSPGTIYRKQQVWKSKKS